MGIELSLENVSILTYLVVFFTGILVCFTPCVYPIMPVVLGYFGASKDKTAKETVLKSGNYILGMALVYAFLGMAAALTGTVFGSWQSNFWLNLIAANVFILMGLFMLDVFTLPQVSFFKLPESSGKKVFGGAFAAGMISGLVIGPCTTPVLGAILTYVATKKNLALGASLLFVYALGMGLPLLVLGAAAGALKKLPRSGEWLVRVKKVFGILLIISGEFFLLAIK